MHLGNTIKNILFAILIPICSEAKTINTKDIQLNLPKITDGKIEIEKVKNLERINALSITLKFTRTKTESTWTNYSFTIRDSSGNHLKEVSSVSLPEEPGIKDRMEVSIASLPDDLKLPIIVKFKKEYICGGDGLCKKAEDK